MFQLRKPKLDNQKLHGIVFGLYKDWWWSWTMPCLVKNFWIRNEWADYRSAAVSSYFSTNADVFSPLHHAIYYKDFQIILLVCATLWNIFVYIYNTFLIKENSEHCLHIAPTLMRFLVSRLFSRRLLQRLCFCFRIVAINPCFIQKHGGLELVIATMGQIFPACCQISSLTIGVRRKARQKGDESNSPVWRQK